MKVAKFAFILGFAVPMSAQVCVTFAGAQILNAFDPPNLTGLLLQPDGSYTAVTGTYSSPYSLVNVVPHFDQWIGSCQTPPKSLTLPSASTATTPLGAASQVLATGDFTGGAAPGAAFTATASPESKISVGVVHSGAASVASYAVPNGAATVATADFNGDGNPDLAVVYTGGLTSTGQSPGGVAILLGNGDGTFQNAVSYPAGANALHVAIADLNADGKLDLAVAADSGSVTILLGNGDGTFRSGATLTAGLNRGPAAVVAADFNGDGKLDLATANEYGGVSILLGNGDGTFQNPTSFSAGSDCAYLAAGDLNKDKKMDLVVANFDADVVTVLLGNGDGTFGAPATYYTTSNPTAIILTDFNHDGNLDIVTGSGSPAIIAPDFGSGEIAVLLGNGDGTFEGGPLNPIPSQPYWVATGDLNGDGKPDVVTANGLGGNLSILLNAGNGKFTAEAPYSFPGQTTVQPSSVALADLNGDGKLDVAATNTAGNIAVAMGNGDGTFQSPVFYTTGNNPFMAAAGDINGDGKPDLVVSNTGTSNSGGSDNGSVSILLGTGNGAFGSPTTVTAGIGPEFLALADINGDGKLDLLVMDNGVPQGLGSTSSPGGVSVLLGKGDGTFQQAVSYATGTNPTAIAVADVNGDGKPDLVVATTDPNSGGVVDVLLGNGDGTFKSAVEYPGQFGVTNVAISDMNGDGKQDIVLESCCGDTELSYLLGNGDGTFQAQVYFPGGPSPYAMAVADLNGDGKPDLAIGDRGSGGGYVEVLLNTTPSSAFVVKSATAGQVEPFAPDSIVAAYGSNLATGVAGATLPLMTTLDGTTVSITDSLGVTRLAPLFYVSPTQVNYEIPDGTAPGTATVKITNGNGVVQTTTIQIGNVSPGLFALTSSGLVAAWVLPVVNGVQQGLQSVYQVNSSGAVVPFPINVAAAGTQYYVEMYGTGIRNAKSVTVTVGGVNVPVLFAGAAPAYAGEDQVNIGPLPASLAGKGNVNILLTADGQAANTVNVTIQ